MSISEDRWFEVWYSQGEDLLPTWLLVVVPDKSDGERILVCDPQKDNNVVYSASTYEGVTEWLVEDEYSLVAIAARVSFDLAAPILKSLQS